MGILGTAFAIGQNSLADEIVLSTHSENPVWIADGSSVQKIFAGADNTGLEGVATDAADWTFNAPSFLSLQNYGRPSFSQEDFFQGWPSWWEVINPPGSQSTVVLDWGYHAIDSVGGLQFYDFVIPRDAPFGEVPFNFSYARFGNCFGDPQPFRIEYNNPIIIPDARADITSPNCGRDGRVNFYDARALMASMNGPGNPYNAVDPNCPELTQSPDLNEDGAVDLLDFAKMQECAKGESYADPNCGRE